MDNAHSRSGSKDLARGRKIRSVLEETEYASIWRGEWLADFPQYRTLSEADQVAWAAWVNRPEVAADLDQVIERSSQLAEKARNVKGYIIRDWRAIARTTGPRIDDDCVRRIVVDQLREEEHFKRIILHLGRELSCLGWDASYNGSPVRQALALLGELFGTRPSDPALRVYIEHSTVRAGLDLLANEIAKGCAKQDPVSTGSAEDPVIRADLATMRPQLRSS